MRSKRNSKDNLLFTLPGFGGMIPHLPVPWDLRLVLVHLWRIVNPSCKTLAGKGSQ
jgi:hypothetical protein